MGRSIKLSPKHGVNPSVGVCFWCGKDDGTVVLPGRIGMVRDNEDIQAPHRAVWSYDPCEKCRKGMEQGITFIEASHEPIEGWPPMGEPVPYAPAAYPTGRWSVMTEEATRRIFTDDVVPDILKNRKAFMDPASYQELFGDQPEKLP